MKYLFLVFVLVCFYACTPNSQNTSPDWGGAGLGEFYYPLDSLREGKVYEYVVVFDGKEYLLNYWHIKSEKDEKGNDYLIWERYSPKKVKDQYIKEWVVKEGVITKEYAFYVMDSITNTLKEFPNNVSQNVVFPFFPSTDSAMAYRFACDMKLPPEFINVKLIRDRKFKEKISFKHRGIEKEAISFTSSDLYEIQDNTEGGYWKQKKNVLEIYAKGIGLVHREETTDGVADTEVTKLRNVFSFEEFEKLPAQQ